ncbi:MAG: mechanosensitive ion channel family protein [Parvularculaceae bacterium]|nr:mechanosensitive ion channel family protein [Parvularculaceae bacterium]
MKLHAIIAFVILALTGAAQAQDRTDLAREKEIRNAATSLSALARDLREDGVDDPGDFERDVRTIFRTSRERVAPVEQAIARTQASLDLLGPAPKEGEPAEASAVADDRAALNEALSFLRGQRTRIRANMDEATSILGELSERRLRDLYRKIMRRGQTLLSSAPWKGAWSGASDLSGAFTRFFTKWSDSRSGKGGVLINLAALAAAFAASLFLFGPVRDWLRRVVTARIEAHEPTPARRVAVAGVKMLARLIPGVVGGFIIIETSRALGLLGAEGVPVARAVWIALVAYLIVDGFSVGLFAPSATAWRLAEVETAKARRASALLLAIVLIVGAKSVVTEIANAADIENTFNYVVRGVSAILVGGILFLLCERRLWTGEIVASSSPQEAGAEAGRDSVWPIVRFLGRALGIAIMAASFAGHVNLADFASSRLYFLAIILALAWFIRSALGETAAWADRRLRATRDGGESNDDAQVFRFWVGLGVDLALLLSIAPVVFVLAGVDPNAVRDFVFRAFVGFRVGGVVISLSDIFFAIATFVGILMLTRLFQGAMQRGPLAHARIDSGIKNSLTTLLGYFGLVLAAVFGLGVLGLDLSNLALIAGALSVGIGFGLQSIVNNFVSGLILLFERPIKAGDWIVTTSGEGIVKKISVRSTEIETFDRAAIIIPNSELIAATVTNWTHKSALGRIRVNVGVAYNSDPELVRDILTKIAMDHPLIVRYPEPFVVWNDFGASSLDFELRAYLSDIGKGLQVRTDIRFEIFKAFKENGIEIPFPQQDVYIRSAPEGFGATPDRRANADPAGADQAKASADQVKAGPISEN